MNLDYISSSTPALIIMGALFILACVGLYFWFANFRIKEPDTDITGGFNIVAIAGMSMFVISSIALVFYCAPVFVNGVGKGIIDANAVSMNFNDMREHNNKAFKIDKLPDNTKGIIAVVVRYGDPGCEDVHDELSRIIDRKREEYLGSSNQKKVYVVSADSEEGKKLYGETGPKSLPYAVYFRQNPTEKDGNIVAEPLYMSDDKGKPTVDRKALNHLFKLQDANK